MTKLSIISDIHLKLRRYAEFEAKRFDLLFDELASDDSSIIILNGDIFDYANPTLEEIQVFYRNMKKLINKTVYIIPGNHEAVNKRISTFAFLPETSYTLVDQITHLDIEGITLNLVSWNFIDHIQDTGKADILISHYRSTMPGLYSEEIDTDKFIHNYKLCILGDIHSRYTPNSKAIYTGCPYSINFTKSTENTGYLQLVIADGKYIHSYIDLNLPQKISVELTPDECRTYKFNPEHLYKVSVEGRLDELRTLPSRPYIIYQKQLVKHSNTPTEEVTTFKKQLDFIDRLSREVGKSLNKELHEVVNVFTQIRGG
jgi:DNA repair exonuclease SbcCD nuclease subunit